MTATQIIKKFDLKKHPEGGYYKRTYRSKIVIDKKNLPNHSDNRFCQTVIYYLIEANDVSKFHKLKSDEIWFFHSGQSITISILLSSGEIEEKILGSDIENGENFQVVIPANAWFAAKVRGNNGFSFVSCTVAPGFDFDDFEIATKEQLISLCGEIERFSDDFFR